MAFASDTLSPVRIFGVGLGDQAGWVVPLAVIAALALLPLLRRRRDPRTGVLLALGGWFAIELGTLDFSSGIVHPYYSSALAPGLAAVLGAGAVADRGRCCAASAPRMALARLRADRRRRSSARSGSSSS